MNALRISGRAPRRARTAVPILFLHACFAGLVLAALLAAASGQAIQKEDEKEKVVLLSIKFPASTDLTGAVTTPPPAAPLGQQVIFTFSAVPDVPGEVVVGGPPGYEALAIYADAGLDYTGPLCALDEATGTIPARGTYERIGRTVVFTPSFPLKPIDLGRNAEPEAVPGLLPGMEYTIFVPLGTSASIPNLTDIRPAVVNPIGFETCPEELPGFFYRNHPAVPPAVTGSNPADGALNAPVNTLSGGVAGFPPEEEFFLDFDQPLLYSDENIAGADHDADGVVEQNMVYVYNEPVLHAALDAGLSNDPALVRIDRRTGADSLVGVTRLAVAPFTKVGLKSIAGGRDGRMLGSSGSVLYSVEYEDLQHPDVCRLFLPRALGGLTQVRGLAFAPDGTLYALDAAAGNLIAVDEGTGSVNTVAQLGTAYGTYYDLAVRADGRIFAVAVSGSGGPSAATTVQIVDLDPLQVTVLFSGPADYTSISMAGFQWLALYSAQNIAVDVMDTETGQFVPGESYTVAGNIVPAGVPVDIDNSLAELGLRTRLVENTYKGSRAAVEPSGILPFGERIEILTRRGLANISFGSVSSQEGGHPAEADLAAAFTTFDPGAVTVDDVFLEDFLDSETEAPAAEYGSLPPAQWDVQDVDGVPPHYEHLLAAHGLSGGGGLGDFVPLGVFPVIFLDTDSQPLPLPDGSTPGVLEPTVVAGGVFHFRDIIIPAGVTVKGVGSNPLVLTATGRIEIDGVIDVSGEDGTDDNTFDFAFMPTPGGRGGPGGGRGGMSNPQTPPDWKELTDLRSPAKAEDGWSCSNLGRDGGRGGESGASGTDTHYMGGSMGEDPDSRASGGGGGSFFQEGGMGYHGLGKYGADPDDPERYFERPPWWFYDGHPNPVQGVNYYRTQDAPGGAPGAMSFRDTNTGNDFIGPKGEVPALRGGQGGGGGGSRLDSMNPATIGLAASWDPPVDRSMYDAKGGGGGGGGGGLGLYALGTIRIGPAAALLADGGDGGGGEVIGQSNYGGGAGGGSGGAVIVDSADGILVEDGACIDVSGGWPGEAKEVVNYTFKPYDGNFCLNPDSGGTYQEKHKASYCCWSVGDGGYGGYGIVQLQVPDWTQDITVENPASLAAAVCLVDWDGPKCTGFDPQTNPHCGCNAVGTNCAYKYWHFKVNYDHLNYPSLPVTLDCLVPPKMTPTFLGPLSYGLSRWIDMGQTIHRDPVGGFAAPRLLDFVGIDAGGVVITSNGYIPTPDLYDIEVDAPDVGIEDYIPAENEVAVLFQGADALVPGSMVPDPASVTGWTADLASLSGKQFVRFRVRLDTASGVPLLATNPKPQVNRVRVKVQY